MNKENLEGYRRAIEDLRDLADTPRHLPKWSHSRDLKFAPAELSDYLRNQYLKLLDKVDDE